MGCFDLGCLQGDNVQSFTDVSMQIDNCTSYCSALGDYVVAGLMRGFVCSCGDFVCKSTTEKRLCDRYCGVPCSGDQRNHLRWLSKHSTV